MTVIIIVISAAAFALFVLMRIKDKQDRRHKARRDLMKAWIKIQDTPIGKAFEEEGFRILLEKAEPIAILDRDGDRFVLANEVANRVLGKNEIKMHSIIEKMKRIATVINMEPNGDKIKRIVVVNRDRHMIHIHIRTGTIIIVLPLLEYEAILAISSLPHEVYHTVLDGTPDEMLIGEVLAGALEYVRIVNTYRSGKLEPHLMQLYEQFIAESIDLENKFGGGDHRQSESIKELVRWVDTAERISGNKLASEEILWQAVPYIWQATKSHLFSLHLFYEDDALPTLSVGEMTERVKTMFYERKDSLLHGKPLYAFALTVGLCWLGFLH